MIPRGTGRALDEQATALGRDETRATALPPRESPLLRALLDAGTTHVHADTASVPELAHLLTGDAGASVAEIDGNTVNQPLVARVIDDYLERGEPTEWARGLRSLDVEAEEDLLLGVLYAIVCARVANDFVRAFARRGWEVSLQLHMGLCQDSDKMVRVGRILHDSAPGVIVKVPFTPDLPHCLLVARDLEQQGIPVNFTSTFSARQVAAAALLANVTRTNVFMGRLNSGLRADLVGEHVDLAAQRLLLELRRDAGVQTQLIVASIRDWQSLVRVAGCDVFTIPCRVLQELLGSELGPGDVRNQLETSYEDALGIAPEIDNRLGRARIARLWQVEPEFVEFLLELRRSADYRRMTGDLLRDRFEAAGFADFFRVPDRAEWRELESDKLPDPEAPLTGQLALDTHFSLRANADFARHQGEIDRRIREAAGLVASRGAL